MCCFSRPVPYVAGTKIFARAHGDGRQALVYSMRFAAAEELAMILPIPVPPSPPEDALRFVSLEGYDRFFDDVRKAFPAMRVEASRGPALPAAAPQAKLVVHDVGDFEASFVPRQADFDRLDERFKLDPAVWAKLPQYADWGFAVFKLKPKKAGTLARLFRRAKKQRVHPMAFVFPNRHPEQLFFPAVHVHDGEVHETADFDHTLYGQLDGEPDEPWERSEKALGAVMNAERAKGLVDPEAHCWRRVIRGPHENRDITLGPPA
jgi:hypothetical protein